MVEDGEKSTKYFCSLEKARGKQNIITHLRKPDGEIVTSQGQLLQEQVSFYQGLYNQATEEENVREAADRFMTDEHFPTLDENDKILCEGILSLEEVS